MLTKAQCHVESCNIGLVILSQLRNSHNHFFCKDQQGVRLSLPALCSSLPIHEKKKKKKKKGHHAEWVQLSWLGTFPSYTQTSTWWTSACFHVQQPSNVPTSPRVGSQLPDTSNLPRTVILKPVPRVLSLQSLINKYATGQLREKFLSSLTFSHCHGVR